MSNYYQGEYTPKHPNKYQGKYPIIYRSNWEKQFMKYCDFSSKIEWWASESTVIPYFSKLERKWRRYITDFTVKFSNGKIVLFEIKPSKETKPPKPRQRKTRRYLEEVNTFARNISKWEYAKRYAEQHGVSFQILTENELRKMGIKIV